MAGKTLTYDPTAVLVTWGPLLLGGFADEAVSVVRNNDTFTSKVGADGTVSRVRTADRSGLITVTLNNTSPSNAELSAIMIEDETITSGAGILPMIVKDMSGLSTYFAADAWIMKPPDTTLSKEITDRIWIFATGPLDIFIGGNG